VFSNFTEFNPQYLFLPYGIILFAYLGVVAIPEMREELGADTKYMKRAIITGSLVTIALYLLFTFVVVGIVGLGDFEVLAPNERIATIALSVYAHPVFGVLANILATLSMFSSYIAIGTGLVQAYSYDYNVNRHLAVFLVALPPLLIALFKLTTFITVLAVTGSIAGGLEGTMLILTYWKAKIQGDRVPEYSLPPHRVLGTIMIGLFMWGIIYYIFKNFF
ncbi:MAG: aromatic amino acid transport family protein, partial [Nanoarchaeota archaeon]